MAEEQEYIQNPALISTHLHRIQERHLLVSITIADRQDTHNSILVSLDGIHKQLLLDALNDKKSHEALMQARVFTLLVEYDGIEIGFEGKVENFVEYEGRMAYLVNFPNKLIYNQRRKAFRVPISLDTDYTVILQNGDQECEGLITNVSHGGLRLEFDNRVKFDFKKYGAIDACQFYTSEGIEIVCRVEVRNIVRNNEQRVIKVGVKFTNINRIQQQYIRNFVSQMQRTMLKRRQIAGSE